LKAKSLAHFFAPRSEVSEQEVDKGIRLIAWDGVCTMSMGALAGGVFLVAFALSLGASNFHIGLLAAIPFLAQVFQIPAIYLVEKVRNRKAICLGFSATSRAFWILIALIPFLFWGTGGLTALILSLLLFAALGAVSGCSWNSWMRDLLPQNILGSVFSRRLMLATGIALVITLLGGFFIDYWGNHYQGQEIYGYSILFLAAIIFGLIGEEIFIRIAEPQMEDNKGKPLSPLKLLTTPLKDKNFRALLIFLSFWSFAISLAAPFFTVYMLVRLEFSLSMVVMLSVLSQVVNILTVRIWGRLSDRFSNKSILLVSGPLFLICIVAFTFTTMPEKHFLTLPIVIAIHIFSGISLAGVTLGASNIALKLSPKGQATSYLAANGVITSLAAGVAALIGGSIALFFATRELSLLFQWAEPAREISMYAINLKGLDFLFIIAFLIGLYSLYRLARVKEEGEVTERIVAYELAAEVAQQMKNLSTVGGLRQLTSFPLYIARHSLRSLPPPRRRKKRRRAETPDIDQVS